MSKKQKLTKEPRQAFFLSKLAILIAEGFSLKEALCFMEVMLPQEAAWIKAMIVALENGQEFYQILADFGFAERITAQIYLAQIHGQFSQALENGGLYLTEKICQKQKLKQLLYYPVLLALFMFGILLAMRILLLPHFSQLFQQNNSATSILSQMAIGLIYYFPFILCGFGVISIGVTALIKWRLKKCSAIEKVTFFLKIKFFRRLLKLYYTYSFSYEWAQLFKSGYQMYRIIQLMKTGETTKLMQEVAYRMEVDLKKGLTFNHILAQFPFFKLELGAIIFHGELTSQLASELTLYSEICQKEFIQRIEKAMGWIQPIIFVGIAFFILCIYLALLLPMFTMMEGIV